MTRIYLSLGTNLGDRVGNLERAIKLLDSEGIKVLRRSSIYETKPQDVLDQPSFLNMVVECDVALFPLQLIRKVLRIERKLGRKRGDSVVLRGPRTIDIDVLLFGNSIIATPALTVPHPRMLDRRFVLEPLLELLPNVRDPKSKRPLSEYLQSVKGQGVVKI